MLHSLPKALDDAVLERLKESCGDGLLQRLPDESRLTETREAAASGTWFKFDESGDFITTRRKVRLAGLQGWFPWCTISCMQR